MGALSRRMRRCVWWTDLGDTEEPDGCLASLETSPLRLNLLKAKLIALLVKIDQWWSFPLLVPLGVVLL